MGHDGLAAGKKPYTRVTEWRASKRQTMKLGVSVKGDIPGAFSFNPLISVFWPFSKSFWLFLVVLHFPRSISQGI